MGAVSFLKMPRSLEEDELSFVIGYAPNGRQELVNNNIGYRRSDYKFNIEHLIQDGWRAQAYGVCAGGNVFVAASAGPLLEQWWPLLKVSPANSTRPVLSAAAATEKVVMTGMGTEVEVTVMPSPEAGVVLALHYIEKANFFSDDAVAMCTALSLPVIKTALLALSEYPTLVDEVPDTNVAIADDGVFVPLTMLLDVSTEMADMIPWQHRP